MIEDKLHLVEKGIFDRRKYTISVLLLKNNRDRDNLYDTTIKETVVVQQSLGSNKAYITGVFL